MTLYVVATPIGNLEDITLRALRILGAVDAVVAEDSRRTAKLLSAHGISRPILSLPAFAETRRIPRLLERMEQGADLALCTDAGTPTVSDPGARLVRHARLRGFEVTAVPGPSAVTAALSVSGLVADHYCFLGFLPRGERRVQTALDTAIGKGVTVVFFESARRLLATLRAATGIIGSRDVVVARELTKIHESLYCGTAEEVITALEVVPLRGECTVVIGA